MERGKTVEVTTFGGRKLMRKVVLDRGTSVVICNQEEFAAAAKENREPQGIAFPRKDIKECD